MYNQKMKIMETIISLRYAMNDYREDRQFAKVAELRLEIARLEALLHQTY